MKALIKKWIWKRLALQWRLRSGLEITVKSHGDWYIYNEIFVNGEYDLAIRRSFGEVGVQEAQPVILDLGANVGFFILRWMDLWLAENRMSRLPRFIAVEPCRESLIEMKQRMEQLQGYGVEITFVHGLVGQRSGKGILRKGSAHFAHRVGEGKPCGAEVVDYVDLEKLIASNEPIQLIKCDIEGSELSFIEHYAELLEKTRNMVIELHKGDGDVAQGIRLMAERGLTHHQTLRTTDGFAIEMLWR